jgi:hypothetical protein
MDGWMKKPLLGFLTAIKNLFFIEISHSKDKAKQDIIN